MSNYIGYFKSLKDITYSVRFITDKYSEDYEEIALGGESPFVVNYDTSDTPFDGIRTSTASITIVHDTYLEDILFAHPFDTIVELHNDTANKTEWVGYLQNNLLNQGYEDCVETITFNANDCLLHSQYLPYQLYMANGRKIIVTIKHLIEQLTDFTPLTGYYWGATKRVAGELLLPDYAKISEMNFFSSDTDKAWSMKEIIEEICKYFGYTCMQIGSELYFIDYNYYTRLNAMPMYHYCDANSYVGQSTTIGSVKSINSSNYMGSGGQISFTQAYNKIKVNCSYSEAEQIIPSLFDDDKLTNLYVGENTCHNVSKSMWYPYYVNASGDKVVDENEYQEKLLYYNRLYSHKNYISHYYNDDLSELTNPYDIIDFEVAGYEEIYDEALGYYTSAMVMVNCYNYLSDDKKDYTIKFWYGDSTTTGGVYSATTTCRAEAHSDVSVQVWVTGMQKEASSKTWSIEVNGRGYTWGNPDDVNSYPYRTSLTKQYAGATIVDLAEVEADSKETGTQADISFEKYLCISQRNLPSNYTGSTTPTAAWLDANCPTILELNLATSPAIIIPSGTFLAIDLNAILERHPYRDYIYSKWNSINSGGSNVKTYNPNIVLKLGIGGMFWNGTSWVNDSNVAFQLPFMPNNIYKEDGTIIDKVQSWNTTLSVKNQVSWREWTGASGYRIPLNNSVDLSGNVTFEIKMPFKMQQDSRGGYQDCYNYYTWLSDINIQLVGNKQIEKKNDAVYENVIDDDNVNTMSDIDLKINTYDNGILSYSYASFRDNLIESICEYGIKNEYQLPEHNIVEKYYHQYSTATKSESLTLDLNINAYDKVNDTYWDGERFIVLRQNIDYMYDRQSVDIMQIKEWNVAPTQKLELETEQLSLNGEASTQSIGYMYTGFDALQLSTNVSWITGLSIESNMIKFNVAQNTGTSPRAAIVTLGNGSISKSIAITQAAIVRELTTSTDSFSFSANAGNDFFYAYYKGIKSELSVSSNKDWLQVSKNNGNLINNTWEFTISVVREKAVSESSRSGVITITDGVITKTISVTQAGGNIVGYRVYYSTAEEPTANDWNELYAINPYNRYSVPSGATSVLVLTTASKSINSIAVNSISGAKSGAFYYPLLFNKKREYYDVGMYAIDNNTYNLINTQFKSLFNQSDIISGKAFSTSILFAQQRQIAMYFTPETGAFLNNELQIFWEA